MTLWIFHLNLSLLKWVFPLRESVKYYCMSNTYPQPKTCKSWLLNLPLESLLKWVFLTLRESVKYNCMSNIHPQPKKPASHATWIFPLNLSLLKWVFLTLRKSTDNNAHPCRANSASQIDQEQQVKTNIEVLSTPSSLQKLLLSIFLNNWARLGFLRPLFKFDASSRENSCAASSLANSAALFSFDEKGLPRMQRNVLQTMKKAFAQQSPGRPKATENNCREGLADAEARAWGEAETAAGEQPAQHRLCRSLHGLGFHRYRHL